MQQEYYRKQITAIKAWKAQEPGFVARAMDWITSPITKVIEASIRFFQEKWLTENGQWTEVEQE